MKTKEQILKWLDEQPWKGEFYEAVFTLRIDLNLDYDEAFIFGAFGWEKTEQGRDVWSTRNSAYRKWYFSNERPMSWEEYCEQNPIKLEEYYIDGGSVGQASPREGSRGRCVGDVNVMSKDLCEAFVAYMKLIQLRNAWVKGFDDNYHKIIRSDDYFDCVWGETGLSFPTPEMANEFIKTFKDLLEVAKPLL